MENTDRGALPVIVAGGGLAAAVGLSRAGYRVVVLEKAQEFGEIGAGIQLGPNAFHALKTLGVADQALANAVYIDRLLMLDAMTGEKVVDIPVDAPFRAYFNNPYAVIHRADLHTPLLDVCRSDRNITLLASHEVSAFAQHDGIVDVATAAGQAFKGAALIGADGVRSRIRESIVGDGAPKVTGHVAYRAVLPIEEMPEELRWNAACLWAGPKCHMVHYPLRGWKLFNIVADVSRRAHDGEPQRAGRSRRSARAFPASAGETAQRAREVAQLAALGPRRPRPRRQLDRRQRHAAGRRGARDASVFRAGRLHGARGRRMPDHEVRAAEGRFADAFKHYQDKRITRTARIVLSSRELGRIYHAAGVERLVRNDMFAAKTRLDFYRSLDWLYGYGREA